jgi:hypothetical protein
MLRYNSIETQAASDRQMRPNPSVKRSANGVPPSSPVYGERLAATSLGMCVDR